MIIKELPTNWRDKFIQAQFRWAEFFVENDARAGGRRVALHEYPKRNKPYAEDMGRSAMKFQVQGYLIGKIQGGGTKKKPGEFGPRDQFGGPGKKTGEPNQDISYLTMKRDLIECLEQDGPGRLRLPLPHMAEDLMVMVQSYSVTESRERGGMCQIEMTFVEYGDPHYRATVSTEAEIQNSAEKVEDAVAGEEYGPPMPPPATFDERFGEWSAETMKEVTPYVQTYLQARYGNSA